MRPKFLWPLVLAAVVLVGVSATIILQIYVLSAPPSIAFPIEFGPTESPGTYTVTISVTAGDTVTYATVAGFGKLTIVSNTTWFYDMVPYIGTAIMSHGGNAEFEFAGFRIVIKTNETHGAVAIVSDVGVHVTPAVKVHVGGWTVYHPVYSDLTRDANMRNMIISILTHVNMPEAYVFQPRRDYLEVDPYNALFVYLDVVTVNGDVTIKGTFDFRMGTEVGPTGVDVNGMACPTVGACVLSTIFAWYRDTPNNTMSTALTVTAK